LKDEIIKKLLIKKNAKATKRIKIKFDKKNSRKMQFNEKKLKIIPNKININ
jgi:hypothetical protein